MQTSSIEARERGVTLAGVAGDERPLPKLASPLHPDGTEPSVDAELRISAIVDARFRLIVDGETASSKVRRRGAQAPGRNVAQPSTISLKRASTIAEIRSWREVSNFNAQNYHRGHGYGDQRREIG